MEDRTLLMLAVFTSLAGLGILWFACANYEPPALALDAVSDQLLGKVVTVQGTVENVRNYSSIVSAQFSNSTLKLFGFQSVVPFIKNGDLLTVTGEIKEYKGELEIVPEKTGDVLIAK